MATSMVMSMVVVRIATILFMHTIGRNLKRKVLTQISMLNNMVRITTHTRPSMQTLTISFLVNLQMEIL